jgi:hypothetical protein
MRLDSVRFFARHLLARLGKLHRVPVDHKRSAPSDPIEVADL